MKPVIIECADLMKHASQISIDVIGKPILKSLKEQRQSNIFCDVSIECGGRKVMAQR